MKVRKKVLEKKSPYFILEYDLHLFLFYAYAYALESIFNATNLCRKKSMLYVH